MVLGGIGDETAESAAACHLIAASLRAEDPASIADPVGRAYRRYVDADPLNDRAALAMAALQMWPERFSSPRSRRSQRSPHSPRSPHSRRRRPIAAAKAGGAAPPAARVTSTAWR